MCTKMVQCKRLFHSLAVPKWYSVNAGNSEKALHTVPKRYSVLYHSGTAKMFLQTIPTTVNDRRRTYTTVNERKTQRNPKKPRIAKRFKAAVTKAQQLPPKASICHQKLAIATKCQTEIYRTAPGFIVPLLSCINHFPTTS